MMDYFVAVDDFEASLVGPDSPGPAALGFPTVPAKRIDPCVSLGKLESILTTRPYNEVIRDSRHCTPITRQQAESFTVTITDALHHALSTTDADRLRETTTAWAETDELARIQPDTLGEFLGQFAALARTATERGHRLYCWWCL